MYAIWGVCVCVTPCVVCVVCFTMCGVCCVCMVFICLVFVWCMYVVCMCGACVWVGSMRMYPCVCACIHDARTDECALLAYISPEPYIVCVCISCLPPAMPLPTSSSYNDADERENKKEEMERRFSRWSFRR